MISFPCCGTIRLTAIFAPANAAATWVGRRREASYSKEISDFVSSSRKRRRPYTLANSLKWRNCSSVNLDCNSKVISTRVMTKLYQSRQGCCALDLYLGVESTGSIG